jgi:hypothetical protein
MTIRLEFSALRRTKWYEYAVRFLFGGAVTLLAGLLAKSFGPVLGGLFLAFPAIFPASATLVEKHEEERKRKAGIPTTSRGQRAAALDARGASIGTLGLICFAFFVWKTLPSWNALVVVAIATLDWLVVSVVVWRVRAKCL